MAFDSSQPFEVLDKPPIKPAFDPAKPFEPVGEAAPQGKPAFDPAQPAKPVTPEELANDETFDPAAHAAQHPADFETAYAVHQARANRSIGQKALGVGKVLANPATYVNAGKGVLNFIRGFGDIATNIVGNPFDALEGKAGKPSETRLAERTLAAQHGEESLKHVATALGGALDAADPSTWLNETPAMKEQSARMDFTDRVEAAKKAQQLAQGQPLDTGVVASIYHAAGQQPSEEVGPQALKEMGVPQADLQTVERMSASSDPANLALAAAPMFPGASKVGGAITEAAGKTLSGTGAAIQATSRALNPLNALRRMVNPAALATDAAKEGGARGLQGLGEILSQQGREMRTGAPSALTTKSATAAATGEGAIGTNIQRAIGDTAAKGAATAAGMAPLNAALSEGDPEEFARSEVGAAAFGGALGSLHRNRPILVEAVRPHLRSEGARALAEAGEGNDPLAARSAAYVMGLPDEARDRTLEAIGALQGLPVDTATGKQRAKLYVLSEQDYADQQARVIGGQQAAMGGGRGFFYGPDGAAYVNGDYHTGLQPNELSHTIGHEFGGHAGINIMRAMGAKGGALYDGLIDSARQALFVRPRSGRYPDGAPTPEFRRFIDGYNRAFDPTGKTIRLDWRDPEAIEEFIAEEAGQIMAGKGAGELALPRNIQDKISDGIGRFMGQMVGIDTRKVGTATHFGREEVGALTKTVQDTLSQIVGMKLRGGAEMPEAPKTDTTRIAELQATLARPRPAPGGPVQGVHDWIRERREAQRELNDLTGASEEQRTASAPEPPVSPEPVISDTIKALGTMGIGKNRAAALIRQANQAHGTPIMDAQRLTAGALRIHGGGTVRPGEFTPKVEAPKEPVPVPTGEKATFKDETGTARVITGASPEAPRVGDIVATRDGEIRRVTKAIGDTVDTARPIDPLNARGTKTHNLSDVQALTHDYDPNAPKPSVANPEPAKPALSVQPKGDRFIVVDAAGNPVTQNTFATEADARKSIAKKGQPSTFGLPPSVDGNDIIDAILEETRGQGIHVPGGKLPEDVSHLFPKQGIWRNTLLNGKNTNVTLDEVARLVHDSGFGDGSIDTLLSEMDKAATARNSLRDQTAAEEKRQKEAAKIKPNEPATPAPPANDIPPKPATPTAVSERPPVAPEPAAISSSDVERIAAEAEQTVVAARAGTKKKASTLPKEVTDAQVDAVAAEHDKGLPANYQGVRSRTDALGKATISGTFNPSRPFDAFLLKLADLSKKSVAILQDLQTKLGQTVTVNYGHAPHEEGEVTSGGRKAAQAASSAQARASGEADQQNEDKNFIPLEVRFNKGKETPSITILGASPEKLLNNFNLATKAVREVSEKLGIEAPIPYSDIHDPNLVADMRQLAENHANGFTYDGRPIEGFPDTRIPKAAEGFTPTAIPQDRFEFLNLMLGDESAKTGVRGQSAEQKLKQGLAVKNQIPMTDAGEVNALREAINQTKGPVTDADGKETTWSRATIENPLSEALRVDLINEVKPEVNNADQSIRGHGFTGDISGFFGKGSPDRTFSAAGFLPDTGAPKTAKEKAQERIAARSKPETTPMANGIITKGPSVQSLPGYHKSGKSFSKFDTRKVGTGEKQLSYGWGIYFGDKPENVEHYAGGESKGHLYTVDIKPEAEQLLHLHKPLSEQGDSVKSILNGLTEHLPKTREELEAATAGNRSFLYTRENGKFIRSDVASAEKHIGRKLKPTEDVIAKDGNYENESPSNLEVVQITPEYVMNSVNGGNLYEMLAHAHGGAEYASKELDKIGVPGIRYDNEPGRWEYVIFNADNIQITHKNGEPVTPKERREALGQRKDAKEAARARLESAK